MPNATNVDSGTDAVPESTFVVKAVALPADIRRACAWVATRAERVRVIDDAIEPYARTLPGAPPAASPPGDGDAEGLAARILTLNAINFGSGWFPTLRRRPGMSGFRTVEAGVRDHGPWSASALAEITAAEVADALGQEAEHELIELFAIHLRELGRRVLDEEGGSFLSLARSGEGSATRLAERLATWTGWRDVSTYRGRAVPFFKRAQIAAADLARAGIIPAPDLSELTMFADNLVPHVLRLDGVLAFDPGLANRIERGELIEHGSPEEIEIRACAVHAIELLVAAHGSTTAVAVDGALWHRGAESRYKAVPRHRTRTTAY